MSSIPLPPALRVNGFSMQPNAVTRAHSGPFGGDGAEAVVDLLQDRWRASFSTTATTRAESGAVEAWLAAQRGGANTTPLYHFARPHPLGTLGRQHAVYGLLADAAQGADAVQLATVPGATLLVGDMVGVSGLLLQCAADCVADGQGVITVPLVNRLRRALTGLRRASTATFVDASGVLQTAAVNVPRFTYFSGKNIYSGPVDLVAGPGVANVSHFLRTSAAGNPPALGFSEVVTVSFQLYQDVVSAAVPGRLARVLVEWRSIPTATSGNALADSVAISPGARQSITITMPTSAVADFDFRITLGKVGGASEGTITAANVMVERGAVATAYEPGARLLVEAAATNLLFPSEPTVAQVPTLSNVTNAAAQYPAFQRSLLFPANGTISFAYLSRALDAGQQFVFSVFVKIAGVPVFTGGTAGSADGAITFGSSVLSVANVQHVGGDLWRIWVTGTGPGAGPNLGVVKYATNSAKQFWVMGYQLEAGATPRGYAVSTSAPATRAADVIAPAEWNRPTRPFRLASRAGVRHAAGYAEGLALDFVEDLTP